MNGPTTPIVEVARATYLAAYGSANDLERGFACDVATALPALLARVRELKEALEPFAHYYESECGDTESDDTRIFGELRICHFRRAALTLNKEPTDGR